MSAWYRCISKDFVKRADLPEAEQESLFRFGGILNCIFSKGGFWCIVKKIAVVSGHKMWVTSLLTPFVMIGMKIPGKIGGLCQKAFGSSYYELEMSDCGMNYRRYALDETVKLTEVE